MEINIDFHLTCLIIGFIIWVFILGVYIQAKYNITAIEISENWIYFIIGFIMGATGTRLYCFIKEE